jgi:uncharacterized membrane protein YGL010W
VHLVGIPTIMLGVFIPLSWVSFETQTPAFIINLAYVATIGLFVFYFTLDRILTVAAAAFFGGYIAQFVGHAVEKSIPVILKHPVQANIAAPFFIVVEIFSIIGLRDEMFREVQRRINELRKQQSLRQRQPA